MLAFGFYGGLVFGLFIGAFLGIIIAGLLSASKIGDCTELELLNERYRDTIRRLNAELRSRG